MALIKCPECTREVSDTAPSCPGCGYVLKLPPATLDRAKPQPSTEAQILIEQRVTNEGPSAGVAYLLWFFLGLVGAHRFYLGKVGSGVIMAVLSFTIIGLMVTGIWWLVDAFIIPDLLREKRSSLRTHLLSLATVQS